MGVAPDGDGGLVSGGHPILNPPPTPAQPNSTPAQPNSTPTFLPSGLKKGVSDFWGSSTARLWEAPSTLPGGRGRLFFQVTGPYTICV